MLQARQLTKKYGQLQVLKGIDLHIQEKEIVAIVGASGAGKSTLLHILGTLDTPDSGEVMLKNQNVTQLRERALARFRNEHIGFIFQFHNLLPEFTALENVCIPGYLGKRNPAQVTKRAQELLSILNLSHRVNHKPSEMSGGEQQRTAVARALINAPSIIFADEPSGNLDSRNAEELHRLFFRLRDELGQTFVIVTHNKELAEMSDRTLEMQDGLMASTTHNVRATGSGV
ncbi:ABC transporter ATP-binding protein [Catalinimonas alkaloidigena]|nr:ABC transporter ATP-binding protein [Catalinimonas alkaloidigena]